MDSARILLAGGGVETETALVEAFSGDGVVIDLVHTNSSDDALTELVSSPFQLCVVRGHADAPDFALEICEGAKEAGVRIPIVVLMDLASLHTEREFLNAGALAAIPWDGSQDSMLRNLVRLTVILRSTEESLRASNDRLVQEMLTMQDERERAEALNAQYVDLAENYALAKEELEKLNQEKNKFFSIIAHDLRSPFTSLLGFTALLERRAEGLNPEQVKEYGHTINTSATRIYKLLENLLEWSRLQMDRVEFKPQDFDLGDVALKTVDVLGPVAAEKGIQLTHADHAPEVHADMYMIDAVIRNLVNNAIKFTPEGGSVTIRYETLDNDKITVSISDTGVGMDEDTQKKLFKLSENITMPGTGGEKGTGLGLILCKELVERNGGQLCLDSAPGQGSTFSFTLPAAQAAQRTTPQSAQENPATPEAKTAAN